MYSLSRILRRSQRYNLAPSSFGAVTKLELSCGHKEKAFKSSGLIYNRPQGLLRFYSARDVFSRFFGVSKLSSVADANEKGIEEDKKEELFEPEETFPVSGDTNEGVVDDSLLDSELGSEVIASDDAPEIEDDTEIEVEHSNEGKRTNKRARSELFESIVAYKSVKHVLEAWVKEGKELSQKEVTIAIHNLRIRRSYAVGLQVWEWLHANTKFEFNETNYASQLDLVAKVHSLQKAENFLKEIPESFRGELVYRTLLANCVQKHHVKKSQDVFNKMRELKFPTSVFACNQMLLLYSKHDEKKIADILLLMERENIQPTRATYHFLIHTKGLAGDMTGMEKIVETMKEEGIQLDVEIQANLARYYIRAGHKERAEEIMKEIEGKGLKETPWVCRSLLPLYADIGDSENVRRLSKFVEQTLRYDNCISAIKAWGKLKEVGEAEALFDKLVEKYKIFPMLPYSALMEIYTENKMLAKGKDLVKRMETAGIKIGPSTWHGLVNLYIKAGEVEKAELLLYRGTRNIKMRPLFSSYMAVLKEYANRGDVHNTEKVFLRMKMAGYVGQIVQYETILIAYINSKTPAYGMRQRLKADNMVPNKTLATKLAQADPFRESPVSVLLDK